MYKIDLNIKINNRDLTVEEQEFIKVWLKILKVILDRELCFLAKERINLLYKDMKEVI